MSKDCTNCKYLIACDHQDKRAGFYCNDHTRFSSITQENPLAYLTNLTELQGQSNLVLDNGLTITMDDTGIIEDEESFSIAQQVREAVNDRSLVPRDIKIDDSSLPQAKNFFDWMINPAMCAGVVTPFLEQMLIGIRLFSEYCPLCSDNAWMDTDNHNVGDSLELMLSKVCLLEYGECPSCGAHKAHLMQDNKLPFYRELAANVGQRGGKSALVGMLSSYIKHRMLKMQNPNSVYTLPANNMFHGTFVALTYAQAKDTLWQPLYGYLTESKWFQEYHSLLKGYEEKYGQDLFKFNDTFVLYRHRSVLTCPVGPDKRILRGKTRIYACVSGQTLVHTLEGQTRIDKIIVGDSVVLEDTYARVLRHEYTGDKEEWCLTLRTGLQLHCSEDHEICVQRHGSAIKVRLADLHPDDKVIFCTSSSRGQDLADHNNLSGAEIAYCLGLLTHFQSSPIDPNSKYTSLTGSSEACCALRDHFLTLSIFAQQCDNNAIVLHSRFLADLVSKYGYIPTSMSTPACMNNVSQEHCYRFLQGVFLNKTISTCVCLHNVQRLALRYGIISVVRVKKDRGTSYIALDEANTDVLYGRSTSCHDNKFHIYVPIDTHRYSTDIKSIEKTGNYVPMYDMEIDHSDHVYVAGGILVSNSCDEVGWMDNSKGNTKVKMNAKEIYIALERSLLTVRAKSVKLLASGYNEVMPAYFMNISSPSSQRDLICELVRQSKHSRGILGVHLPTWKMNPDVSRDVLQEEFDKDPIAAMRDYGAVPPLTTNPFLPSKDQLSACWKKGKPNAVKVTYRKSRLRDKTKTRWAEATHVRACSYSSLLAIDAGRVNNSFALAVGHLDPKTDIPIIDAVMEVIPLPDEPINFTYTYDSLISPIIEARNAVVLLADRWNSDKILDDAASEYGILAAKYSLKYNDMFDVKTRIEQQELILPKPTIYNTPKGKRCKKVDKILEYSPDQYPTCFIGKTVEHFILQCLTIVDTGSQVLKGDGDLTDDMWRAVCLCVQGLTSGDYTDELNQEQEVPQYQGTLGTMRKAISLGGGTVAVRSTATGGALGTMRKGR